MTVRELIARLNELDPTGDAEVLVNAFGGMRTGKGVEKVTTGFDWDVGAVIIHPDQPLTLVGRTCPKCQGQMAHFRLKGYQCPRCG